MRRNRKKQSAASAHQTRRVLTQREVEVTRLLAKGLRNRAIGEKLSIKEGTVKVHLHMIYEKLDVDSRLGLALYARAKGLA
jgi:DNA-binding NarL/FixJ family response regulator